MNSNIGKILISIGGDATQFQKAIGGVQRDLNRFSRNLDKIAGDISTKVSAPLALVGGIATAVGASFSDGMLRVQALTNSTGDEIEKLTKKAKELGINTSFSATQVTQSMQYMALAGWNTTQIMDGVKGVLDLAASSGEDLATVSDILTDGLSAFNKEASYSARMADILATTSARANTDVTKLGDAFRYVAPVAGALNFEVEDTLLVLGTMANNGIKASQAGTALRATLSRMVKPTKESQKALDLLNYSIINSDGTIKPLTKIVEDLRGKFANLTPAQKASTAAMLGGQEAMSGLLALMNAPTDKFNELKEAIEDSNGAADRMAKLMNSGLGGALRKIRSSIEGILVTISENLTPYIIKASEVINQFSNAFNNLSPNIQSIATGFGVMLTVIPPLILAFGQIIKLVSSSIGAIKILIPLIGGISAPVLGIAAAVGATAYLIYKYWDDIVAYFTTGNGIQFLNELKILWSNVLFNIRRLIQTFTNTAKDIWSKYGDEITQIFSWLGEVIMTTFNIVINQLTLVVKYISTFIDVIVKLVKGDFKGAFESVGNFIKELYFTIFESILSVFGTVIRGISGIADVLGFDTIANGLSATNGNLSDYIKLIKKAKEEVSGGDDTPSVLTPAITPPTTNTNTSSIAYGGHPIIDAIGVGKRKLPPLELKEFNKSLEELKNKGIQLATTVDEMAKRLTDGFNDIINNGIANGLSSFGDALGQVISGSAHISSIGVSLLTTLADVMGQLGKMAIAAGLAIQGIKAALKSLNPYVAIAAGVALIALSSAIKSGASNMGDKFGGSRAEGGNVDFGKAYYVGERGKELFVPNQSGTIVSSNDLKFGGNQAVNINGKLTAEGSDLVYVFGKEQNKRGRK
ncbi:phage tail tape measure protein [Echinicola shivajiensis]|uniref:phage tail tape measure protein n=1 Tax=Echinicola shivajiensis TaxID=1035916 RepID=UPI001BFC7A6C|nr:phage tail tape measure protein [Echinicola shivajiensis]